MDPLERLERIRALQAAAAEHRAEIARREAEREADPVKMQNFLLADQRASGDPDDLIVGEGVGSPPASAAPPPGIITKDYGGDAALPAPEAERGASDDDSDLDDYSQGVVRFTVEYVKQKLVERDERIDTLEEEVVRLKRAIRELARRGKRRA